MKSVFMISVFFCSMNLFSQDINTSLLENKKWMLLHADNSRRTYISDSKDVTDKFTIRFNQDGSFSWHTNPSCGTHIGAVSGVGSWSYKNESSYLILDFKNVTTDSGEKWGKECYKIDSLTNNTLALSKLMQCGKK